MQPYLKETHWRTLARAITYRLLAIISSFMLVGIGDGIIVEISKTAIYYLLERLWLYTQWQINEDQETQFRIVTRAIVYRAVATIAVAYWVGIEMALWLALIQTLLFYINERVWQRISWGKFLATS
jgi:uncharacterized membrane protein